jgi:hypothetical protein
MDERERHPATVDQRTCEQVDTPSDNVVVTVAPGIGMESADCCSARPAFRAVLPANATRTHPTELLFCGHHLHASQAALHDAAAVVYDRAGALVASTG